MLLSLKKYPPIFSYAETALPGKKKLVQRV